jgi:hypothetical protein
MISRIASCKSRQILKSCQKDNSCRESAVYLEPLLLSSLRNTINSLTVISAGSKSMFR